MQTKTFDVYDEKNTAVRDAYAMLAANVHFSSARKPLKTLAICSSVPRTGKTTLAINLSISLARSGWKTLMIDSDLRKPSSFKRLGNDNLIGLSDILTGNAELNDGLSNSNINNLTYLPCGVTYQNPIELLCSANFEHLITKTRDDYDYIVFDTPALASVIDGALVASITDGTLLVAKMGSTRLRSLNQAKEQLENANANILGVVLNQVEKRDYVRYVEHYNYFKQYNSKDNK